MEAHRLRLIMGDFLLRGLPLIKKREQSMQDAPRTSRLMIDAVGGRQGEVVGLPARSRFSGVGGGQGARFSKQP